MLLEDDYSEKGLMPVMDGLVCWLDGRDGSGTERLWKDRSGNGNDCTLHKNMEFSNTNGWTGNSLLVDGKSCSYGELHTMKNMAGNNWTFELKFNNEKYNIGLLSNMNSYRKTGFSVFHYNNIGFEIRNKQSESKQFPFEFINNNTVTITISENGEVKLYKNGVYLFTAQYDMLSNGNFPYNAGGWCVGTYGNSSYGMRGEIFSLRIYNRVLKEKEVQQNYEYEQTIKRGE